MFVCVCMCNVMQTYGKKQRREYIFQKDGLQIFLDCDCRVEDGGSQKTLNFDKETLRIHAINKLKAGALVKIHDIDIRVIK